MTSEETQSYFSASRNEPEIAQIADYESDGEEVSQPGSHAQDDSFNLNLEVKRLLNQVTDPFRKKIRRLNPRGVLLQSEGDKKVINAGTYLERPVPSRVTDQNFSEELAAPATDTDRVAKVDEHNMFVQTLNNSINRIVSRTGLGAVGAGSAFYLHQLFQDPKIKKLVQLLRGLKTEFDKYVRPLIIVPEGLENDAVAVAAIRYKYFELIINEMKIDLGNITAGTYNSQAQALRIVGRMIAGTPADASTFLTPEGLTRLNELGYTIQSMHKAAKGSAVLKTELFKPIAKHYRTLVQYAGFLNGIKQAGQALNSSNPEWKKTSEKLFDLVKKSLPGAEKEDHNTIFKSILKNLGAALTIKGYADFVEYVVNQNEKPLREIGANIMNIDVNDPTYKMGTLPYIEPKYGDFSRMIERELANVPLLSGNYLPEFVQQSRQLLSLENITGNIGVALGAPLARGVGTAMNIYKSLPDEGKYYLNELIASNITDNSSSTNTTNMSHMLGN